MKDFLQPREVLARMRFSKDAFLSVQVVFFPPVYVHVFISLIRLALICFYVAIEMIDS